MKLCQVLSSLLVAFSLSGCEGDEEEVHLGTRIQAEGVSSQAAYTITFHYGDETYVGGTEAWDADADEDPCCPGWGRGEIVQKIIFLRAGSAERDDGTPYEDGDVMCPARRFKWRFLPVEGFSMEERVLIRECVVEDPCFQTPCGPQDYGILAQSRDPGSDATGTIYDYWMQGGDLAEDPPDAEPWGTNYPRSFCHAEDIAEDVPPGDAFCPLVGANGEPPPPHWCSLALDDDPETRCEPLSDP